jgi:L-asparaginase
MTDLRKVALIGTGGTISAVGSDPYDLIDYYANGQMLDAAGVLGLLPRVPAGIDVITVPLLPISSTGIYFNEWKQLVSACDDLVRDVPNLVGIVISHGTASMEETAYFLNLTLKVRVPVVLVGSQRPSNALSSDAGLNLYNALRVAADPDSWGLGVLVVLNDEIHAAREVTKTSTYRLQTFRSPDVGLLGHCDGDSIAYYRLPVRLAAPNTEFDLAGMDSLPKVGISYSHTGSDGCVIRAFIAAGMRGIVVAAFAPGCFTSGELAALREAVAAGIKVVVSTRAGSGRIGDRAELRENGLIAADNLNPQKARLLLALALTRAADLEKIKRIFATY